LHLLIGLVDISSLPIDQRWRLATQGRMLAPLAAEAFVFDERAVDPPHQAKVLFGLPLGCVVERRARDRLIRVVWRNHAAPHFSPQGFSFRSQKELATANSPIWCAASVSTSLISFSSEISRLQFVD
jgi:hypothetical protein